jgi:hypothetical protein
MKIKNNIPTSLPEFVTLAKNQRFPMQLPTIKHLLDSMQNLSTVCKWKTLRAIKNTFAFMFLIYVSGIAKPAPFATEETLKYHIGNYGNSPRGIKYVFVDEEGKECCSKQESRKSYKAYILDITAKAPVELIFSSEIDQLFKEHFTLEIDQDSIIETPHGDFLVVRMFRPHEYNPKSIRCAAGMGEDRTYVILIHNKKISFINRNFLGCADKFEMINNNSEIGYEVTSIYNPPHRQPIKYLLENGKLIKQKVNSK